MDDREKIQSFGDMVNATERLTRPWKIALLVTNILWAVAIIGCLLLMYFKPSGCYQYQDFDGHNQYQQSGINDVTDGMENASDNG